MSPDFAGPGIDLFCDVQQREAAAREEFEVIWLVHLLSVFNLDLDLQGMNL
jgi:hypothetical protein